MITIDGAAGEGGGQILRTALSLSAMTRRPICLENIRANRGKPGLMRQHLTAVRAVAEICNAKLEGAELNSTKLVFEPRGIRGGEYHFKIGSAGSAVLVAQTILPVLLKAEARSSVVIEGGTHVQGAPIFEFFDEVFLPQLRRMGCEVSATLERHGFFPAGCGRIRLEIEPLGKSKRYEMLESGALESAEIVAIYSGIDSSIAKAEADIIAHHIEALNPTVTIRGVDAICSGNAVYLKLKFEHITEIFSAIGAIERSRKDVAQSVVKQYNDYRKVGLPVGRLLADQLMLPIFCLDKYGAFRTSPWSMHSKTNLNTISKFDTGYECDARPLENGIEFETYREYTICFSRLETRYLQSESEKAKAAEKQCAENGKLSEGV